MDVVILADSGGTKLVLPAANELIWGTVAFLLFLLVLWRAGVWKRLGDALEERTRRIRSDLEAAEQTRLEAEETLKRYRQQLAEAREEAGRIVAEAREAAEQLRRELSERAEREANQILERARSDIDAERRRALNALRREVGRLAVDVAEKVVGESLDGGRQERLVDRYVAELSESESGNGKAE